MPAGTPKGKILRSNSLSCTLPDIEALISSSISAAKDDIINTFKKELRKVNDTLESLTGRINNIEIHLAEIENKQIRQDNDIKSLNDKVNYITSQSSTSNNDLYKEIELRLSKKENVVISGIPESNAGSVQDRITADEAYINCLMEELDIQNVKYKRIERIGKIPTRGSRLLRVCGLESHKRVDLLKKSKELRNSTQYRRVYIHADLTPMQRHQERELQNELRDRRASGEDVVIYRGKIQPRKQAFFH